MNKPVFVFDFDKTLTNVDTVFGFYSIVSDKGLIFKFKKCVILLAALIYKAGIINNDKLKEIGVKLFLKGISKHNLEEKALTYAKKIKLNHVYYQHYLDTPKNNRIIISASFEIYLKKIFPDEKVIASKLTYRQKKVFGLGRNMFGEAKKKYLLNQGISEVERLYTDSYSDGPIMDLSKNIFFVKDGSIKKLSKKNNFNYG